MTQLTPTRSFLKHSQPLLTKCLQAALIAAPVLLAAAPSEAATTVKTTLNGFTGLFAPANWVLANGGNSNNTVTITPGTTPQDDILHIFKTNANNSTPLASRVIDTALVDALRPSGAGKFLGWKAIGKYTFTGTNLGRLAFEALSNDNTATLGPVASFTPFSIEGSGPNPADGVDSLDFIIRRDRNSSAALGTGDISHFKFQAEYEVPGPLPVVGAAAAFAWSRRLRKRLNSAKSLA